MSKIKFVSAEKNPYALKRENTKVKPGEFVPSSKAGTAQMFRNNTMHITGRKVTFKHV